MALRPIEILINARDEASGVFDKLSNKLKVVGAAVAGYFGVKMFVSAVEGAADFEQALSRVQAATGASAEEMERLKTAAQDAGANTKYTSVEAAAALENLAKAGLSAGDAIETLPAVLALAQAGDIELATSAEYVTKAVMGMGLAFSDAGRVADVLALGANATNTSVEGLAQALSYAAPTANSLGVSLESTVAIIGKFADAGIDASRAGTALNSIMSQFSDPASKFRRELADAGITTSDFEDALHQLAAAGPAGAKAINAVGLEAGPALKALLNQGMGSLDELKAKLDGAAGSAAATAKVMEDNLNGSLKGLSSAWDTVKNVLGTPVLPVLQEGVEKLAGALRSAVADGTVQKFGESIAAAFQAGLKWSKEFLAQVDFTKLAADLRAFADRSGEVFDQIGEYARNAGDIVKTAYGVMSAGANTVMGVVYLIGEAFAGVISNIQSGVALLYDAFAKITFGDVSAAYKQAADEIRLSAEATWAASEELGKKSTAAFVAVADSAQLARDGFTGLTSAIETTQPAAAAAADAVAVVAEEMRKEAEAAYRATEATEKKQAADLASVQASEAHAAAIATLRSEYGTLIASGNLQAAADKLNEINSALRGTPPAAADAGKAAEAAAAKIAEAFTALGVTSSAVLQQQAANAQAAYRTIADAGTSSAEDIGAAFKVAADKAIAANKGIAPSWVEAQAAARGYVVEVDAAGKAVLKSMADAATAVDKTAGAHQKAAGAVGTHAGAVKGLAGAYDNATAAADKYARAGASMDQKYAAPGKGGLTNTAGTNATGSQGVWSRSLIIDYLKQSGLDEKFSEELAQQFANRDGSVDYEASGAQKKWGGKYSTLSEALGKMVDYYKNDQQGKFDADQRAAILNQKPAPPASQDASRGVATVVNLTLEGVRRSIPTDAAGAAALKSLVQQLAAGKATYQ